MPYGMVKIKVMRRKTSLRTRLFAWTLAFSIIPVFLATSLGYYYGKKYIFREIQNHIATLLKLELIKIDTFVNTNREALRDFAYRDLSLIMTRYKKYINLKSVINSLLSSKTSTIPHGTILLICDPSGTVQYFSQELKNLSLEKTIILYKGKKYIRIDQPFEVRDRKYFIIALFPISTLIQHLGVEDLTKIGFQVELYDFNGNLIFSSEPFKSPIPGTCYYSRSRSSPWVETGDYISRCQIYQPLNLILTISRDKKSAFSAIIKLRNAAFIFIFFVTLFTIAITSLFANEITYPLKQMSEKARIIGEGNLSERVPVLREDEIGKFAIEFNRMADKLEKLYGTLEEKVAERTRDLQKALGETQAISKRLELILENISAGVITMRENSEVIEINKAARKIFPISRGENFLDFIAKHCGKTIEIEKEKSGRINCEKGERELIIDYRVSSATESIGEPILIFTFDDITEKVLYEQKLIESEKMATIGVLAAGLAHEIGTPLNVIMGRAEVLMESLSDNPTAKRSLRTIIEQIERITSIIRQLMDFVKPKEPALRKTNITKVSDRIIDLLQIRLKKKKIEITKDYDPDLPEVLIDPHQWEQVFLNLIMNAIDATGENGKISVAIKKANSKIVIRVADNGMGISQENLNRIFDPFFTTKKPGQGTGLGLTVTRNIVKQHGGWIKVRSEPGKGTTFTIILPAGEEP